MAWSRHRTLLRRFALALASAQVLAYSAAPMLEALTERSPGPTHIEAAKDASCVPVHTASHCMACQLLTLHARKPEAVRAPDQADVSSVAHQTSRDIIVTRAPPPGFRTRAPPIHLG